MGLWVIISEGWYKSATAPGISVLDDAGEPLGARCVDGRCHKATTRREHEPCRVTASSFRLMREKLAARAAALAGFDDDPPQH
jgi:hypothetical protein